MFSRRITDDIELVLAIPHQAEELFHLVEKNRVYLRQWLPWLDGTRSVDDSKQFLEGELNRFASGEGLTMIIEVRGTVAGVVGFNRIDKTNQIGSIGYWLGEEFSGDGVMTKAVTDLIEVGREYYGLRRFDIRCASENQRSRRVAERLGFEYEGTLKRAERVYDQHYDHLLFAKIIEKTEQVGAGDAEESF
jgi:ribosomal-protein-serine acetyltransferase